MKNPTSQNQSPPNVAPARIAIRGLGGLAALLVLSAVPASALGTTVVGSGDAYLEWSGPFTGECMAPFCSITDIACMADLQTARAAIDLGLGAGQLVLETACTEARTVTQSFLAGTCRGTTTGTITCGDAPPPPPPSTSTGGKGKGHSKNAGTTCADPAYSPSGESHPYLAWDGAGAWRLQYWTTYTYKCETSVSLYLSFAGTMDRTII